MPPLDSRVQTHNKPFKQRKSFGKLLRATRVKRGTNFLFILFSPLCSYQEAGGDGDPIQVPQQDPGEFTAAAETRYRAAVVVLTRVFNGR